MFSKTALYHPVESGTQREEKRVMQTREWARIRELERFGVGNFNDQEIAEKCAFVNKLMSRRGVPVSPSMSVIVPAYKEEGYILSTLRSLAEQSYMDCEFIIVSNGEPEGNPTQRIVEASGFRVVHDPIGGISRARQTGLEVARGKIIVTTDADTVHHSRWLERIAEIMSNPDVPCGAGLARSLSLSFSVRSIQAFSAFTMQLKNAISPALVTGVSEATCFFRRELALACGGYDHATRVGEGIILFNNFRKHDVPIIYTDSPLIVATSGRRQEREGALRWFAIGFLNTTLQLLGRKGVGYNAYPDIR